MPNSYPGVTLNVKPLAAPILENKKTLLANKSALRREKIWNEIFVVITSLLSGIMIGIPISFIILGLATILPISTPLIITGVACAILSYVFSRAADDYYLESAENSFEIAVIDDKIADLEPKSKNPVVQQVFVNSSNSQDFDPPPYTPNPEFIKALQLSPTPQKGAMEPNRPYSSAIDHTLFSQNGFSPVSAQVAMQPNRYI